MTQATYIWPRIVQALDASVHHAAHAGDPETLCGLHTTHHRWTASWPFVTCRTCRDKGGRP